MTRCIAGRVAVVSVLAALAAPPRAYGDTIPEFVAKADAVAVGTTERVEEIGTGTFEVARDPKGQPIVVPIERMRARFLVQDVIKGPAPRGPVGVLFVRNARKAGALVPFCQLVPGQRVLIFLESTGRPSEWSLFNPRAFPGPAIPVGDAYANPGMEPGSPLRTVLLYLVSALRVPQDPAARLDVLDRLRSTGFLLHNTGWVMDARRGVQYQLRTALGEPMQPLEEFTALQVLPALRELAARSDTEVWARAAIAQGALQDPTAIPALVRVVKLGDPNYSVAGAMQLGEYRVREAVPSLIPLLSDTTAEARANAARSLGEIRDRRALPYLLEHLDDADVSVRYQVNGALYQITGEGRWPGVDEFGQDPEKYLSHWRKWAKEHEAELKALRAEMEAAMGAAAGQGGKAK